MHYTICDYLLDIAQNGVEAKATDLKVALKEDEENILFSVEDNGVGMDEETLKKAQDPFYTDPNKHKARKAGFGLPFLIQATEMCEGSFDIWSQVGVGTKVTCSFSKRCVDTPPLGNVVTTAVSLFSMAGEYDLLLDRENHEKGYSLSRSDLLDALGELETVASLKLAREFLFSQEEEIII